MTSEQKLFERYITLKKQKADMDETAKEVGKKLDKAQMELLEHLDEKGATATAKYEGQGYVKVMKPRLFASVKVENRDRLMVHLNEAGRQDLIKTNVPAPGLSAWVSEAMENGQEVPDFVDYYLKPQLRLFK